MADKTGISWTQSEDGTPGSTWNPIVGCSKVSPGCSNCYAETLALRFGWSKKPWLPENAAENVILKPERLDQPLRWKRPRKIFVNSLSDLWHDQVPDDFIDKIFAVMALAPQHTYQILTKRPERMREYIATESRKTRVVEAIEVLRAESGHAERAYRDMVGRSLDEGVVPKWPLLNVWLGTSVENARWRTRIDELRETPAAVRFLSCEPLLGSLTDWTKANVEPRELGRTFFNLSGIDWVIVGGESGPGARPMDEQWVRDIRDACKAQGTAFWMKQFGEVWSKEHLGHSGHAADMDDFPEDLQIQEWPATSEPEMAGLLF